MKLTFSFIGLIVFTSFNFSKLRLIYLDKVLTHAKQIKTIVVYGYTDSTMLYNDTTGGQIQNISSRNRENSESYRNALIKSGHMLKDGMAGLWPQKGDTILIVVGEKDRVEVFARKIGSMYRFWDPNNIPFANSFFIFPSKPPYYLLPICRQLPTNGSEYVTCEDGCLVDIDAVKEK